MCPQFGNLLSGRLRSVEVMVNQECLAAIPKTDKLVPVNVLAGLDVVFRHGSNFNAVIRIEEDEFTGFRTSEAIL